MARIDSRELTEWMAYDRLEPFGEARGDLRSAISTTATVNHLKGLAGARGRPAQVEDFLPFRERPEPTAEGVADKVRMIFGRRHGNTG